MGAAICQDDIDDLAPDMTPIKSKAKSLSIKRKPAYECIQMLTHHRQDVTCLIVLKDTRLASGSLDRSIVLWREGKKGFAIDGILRGHTNSVIALTEMLYDIVCSASVDKTLRLWKLSSMKCEKILQGHEDSVLVSIQLQCEFILSGSDDRTIRVWALNKKKKLVVVKVLEGHHKPVSTLIAREEEGEIISGSDDGTVRFWCIEKMVCIDVIDDFNKSAVYCVRVEGESFVVACGDGNVHFVDMETRAKTLLISFSKFGVTDFFADYSWREMGFACADGRARIWKIGTKKKKTIRGHTGVIKAIKGLQDGRIVTCSQDKTIRIWKRCEDGVEKNHEGDEEDKEEEEEEMEQEEKEEDYDKEDKKKVRENRSIGKRKNLLNESEAISGF